MKLDFFKHSIRKRGTVWLSVLFIFSFQTRAVSQISAFVDRQEVALNEALTFTIQVETQTKKPKALIFPNLSELRDFNVLEKWSGTQESISFINGKMTRKSFLTRNYKLQPKTQGRLRLDSFDVKVDGKAFKTKEIFIQVTPPVGPSAPSQPFSLSPFSHGFKNLFPTPFQKGKKARVKFKLFLDKPSAYVGEMVLADWVAFSSVEKINYQIERIPTLKGFWRKELVAPGTNAVFLGTEVIDGVLYKKELLHSFALFPVETGELEIDTYTIRFLDLFSFSGGGKKSTTPRRFSVKPLPSEGQRNFSGAVGDFKIKASLSEKQTQTGKPLSYKLRFEGTGQVRTIQTPKIPFPSSVKIYPPAEKSEFTVEKSWKEFEFLIIPQSTGIVTIPSFSLTTFHPKSEKYRFHQIPSFSFDVTKGEGKELSENLSFFGKDSKEPEQPQWNFLSKNPLFVFNQKILLKFWIIFYAAFILAFVSLYSIRRRNQIKISLEEDLEIQFKKIQELADQKHTEKTAVALINLIYQTVSQITQDRETSQEWEKMLQALPPSLHRKFAEPLTILIQELEAFSFAPKGDSSVKKQIQPLVKRTYNLLRKIVSSLSNTSRGN
ncbi:MAG: BatD family protein [Bdellovibrionales bacterium]|nr:BatD family protein [Bdellovibrionales bacterium]